MLCDTALYLGSHSLGHRLVGLDPKCIFCLNNGRELFHSLGVMDREHLVGVRRLVRLVYLMAINSLEL